jgi:hypothetical protein
MKKIATLILFSLSILFFTACEEEPPYINLNLEATITDTTYTVGTVPAPQPKTVIIEEFTGVRCPNCPDAQAEAKRLSQNNPGRVNIVTIHPLNLLNSLTRPFDKNIGDKHTSNQDMRTDAGRIIFQLIGVTQQLPTGSINRRLFSGETNFAVDFSKWAAFVNNELAQTNPVNISVLAKNIGDSIEVSCELIYTENVADSNYLTIMITEDGIIDVQEKRVGGLTVYDEEYEHNHVLRAVVTSTTGDLLNPRLPIYQLNAGRAFKRVYRIARDPKWNANKLNAIALVHSNPIKKLVLQSIETNVQ